MPTSPSIRGSFQMPVPISYLFFFFLGGGGCRGLGLAVLVLPESGVLVLSGLAV